MTYNEKKSLYESIMRNVAKTVKRRLNESVEDNSDEVLFYIKDAETEEIAYFTIPEFSFDNVNTYLLVHFIKDVDITTPNKFLTIDTDNKNFWMKYKQQFRAGLAGQILDEIDNDDYKYDMMEYLEDKIRECFEKNTVKEIADCLEANIPFYLKLIKKNIVS